MHEFESGFFTDSQPAWHELGIVLPDEALNTEMALTASGLDWTVRKEPVERPLPTPRYYTVRESDNSALGIVGENYRVVQNHDAFDWMDTLLAGEGFHYKTAGSLRSGAVTWLLAKAPFAIDLPDSPGELFVLLTNAHDGTGSVVAAATPVRVVCMNTLRSALSAAAATVKIRHTVNAESKLREAQRVLGLSRGAAERIEQLSRELAAKKVGSREVTGFLETLIPLEAEAPKATETRVRNARDLIQQIYDGDQLGQREIRGTAWGLYNATVAYNDHALRSLKTKTSTADENRFERITSGDNIGARALALLS